jgi:hypothetical protein
MIELFPPSSLDNSILASVWIGLVVTWLLQEAFGWQFTGLVVPGYLASVFIIQPTTGVVIALEGMVTYLVVQAISERGPRFLTWFPMFGRDRFFLVLLVSVAVRLLLEGVGFDALARATGIAVSADLHSMGLVLVPLTANAFQRTGLGAGVPRLAVPLLVTWALLEFVFLRYTNLSLSSFELTYEDLAVDFVSSPKAYMILLCGAWLGSQVNVRYGWDFGGIVVPGLLALCWLDPMRYVATLGEAAVILVLLRVVMRLPWFRSANISGGRPAVLAFTLAFIVKWALGWAAPWLGLGVRATDLYGFGYLLTTLIALRALRGKDLLRPMVAATLTSFGGFAIASAVGYVLAVLWPVAPPEDPVVPMTRPGPIDVVRAAVVDRGPVPDLSGFLDAPVNTVVHGGDGFGAAWRRPSDRQTVVTGLRGAPGLALATVGLSEVLDARATLLCARPEYACKYGRRQLSRQEVDGVDALVVEVVPGDTSVLRANAADLDRLGFDRLAAAIGDFTHEHADVGHAVLSLSPEARARVASAAIGVDPNELVPAMSLSALTAQDVNTFDASMQEALDETVLQPLFDWLEQDEARVSPAHATAALRAAAGAARSFGLTVSADDRRAQVVAVDWRVIVDRQGTGPIVYVPFEEEAPNVEHLARLIAWRERAPVLIEDAPPYLTPERYDRMRAPHAVVLTALERREEVSLVSLRGIRDVFDAGAEVVLALGQPLEGSAELPVFAGRMRSMFLRMGESVSLYDGAARRLSFLDPFNPGRVAAHVASQGRDHVTLWSTTQVRERLRPIEGDHPQAITLATYTERTERSVDEMAGFLVETPVDAQWADVRDSLDKYAIDGRQGDLFAASAAAKRTGATFEVWCEPWLGCRWAVVEQCDATACSGVVLPIAGRTPTLATLEPDGLPEALLFGMRDIGFAGAPVEASP